MPLEMLHEGDARAALREWAYAQLLSYGQAACRRCKRRDVALTARRFAVWREGARREATLTVCRACARDEGRRLGALELRDGWAWAVLPGKPRAVVWALRGGWPERRASAGLQTTHAARLVVNKDYDGAQKALRAAQRYQKNPDLQDVLRIVQLAASAGSAVPAASTPASERPAAYRWAERWRRGARP